MTGATLVLGGNALVFIEQMYGQRARQSITGTVHTLGVCLWRQYQRRVDFILILQQPE
jgi:hypothetical protein